MIFYLFLSLIYARCNNPELRVEWRQMQPFEQRNYISAVTCLKQVPSVLNVGSPSRYDDFVWAHMRAFYIAHSQGNRNAHFLPWHRLYLHWYQVALRFHCGYNNRMPYWDWVYDGQDADSSPIWDSFGKDGRCVRDGPFSNFRDVFPLQKCLSRNFNFARKSGDFDAVAINHIYTRSSFIEFSQNLENIPHSSIHTGTGGDMGSADSAANDPIFFLHHMNVDRIWAAWSKFNSVTFNGEHILDIDGRNVLPANLRDTIDMLGVNTGLPGARDYRVRDVLSTTDGPLCYQYSELPDNLDHQLKRRSVDLMKSLKISTAPCSLMTREEAFNFKISDQDLQQVQETQTHLCQFRDWIRNQSSMATGGIGHCTVKSLYQTYLKHQ